MPQHFLLTAEARSLSVREVFALSDEQAFDLFRELRWGKGEKVICPECAEPVTGSCPVAGSGAARPAPTPSR
jgi:hypothetical protein